MFVSKPDLVNDRYMKPLSGLRLILIFAATAWASSFALAQETYDAYPTKPVRVVVPSAPGGAIDIQARLLSLKLSESMKKAFVVENRAGAGNTIGISYVAKSAPDGYTLLALAPGFTFSPALYKNLPYDPEKDFVPISLVAKSPYLLVTHPSLPVRSIKEWIAFARSRPGQMNTGVPGGAFGHLATIFLAESAKVKIQIIPFKGTGPVVIGLIAGELHMAFANVLSTIPYVKMGKLQLLGASTIGPTPALPGVPSISEAVPGFELYSWHGWVAPAATPPALVNKIYMELAKVSKLPEIAKALSDDGGEPIGSTPDQFRQFITTEIVRWRKVVTNSNMTVQ